MNIRKLLPIIFLIAAGCAGVTVSQEFAGIESFKGIKWGMSRDKVQVVTGRDLKKMDGTKSYIGDVMYGMPCKITFDFGYKDSLKSVVVDYDVMNPEAEHAFVAKNISDIFGPPKKGKKETGIWWHSPDTAAVLVMTGGDEKEMNLTFVQKEK